MADQPTVQQRIESTDAPKIATAILEEWKARKKRREHLEKHWKEIDRQLRMEPEISHKLGLNGRPDPRRKWMPEIELPLQASALETILSDVRRLRYPSNASDWFDARAALTQEYYDSFRGAGSPYLGESKQEFKDRISQDDADMLVQGYVSSFHNAYDFRGHVDLCDAQAICYGSGVGRIRRVKNRILGFNARMKPKEKECPVIVPRDIKKVFFDDSQHALMHEGVALGPAIIQERMMKLVDLKAAAQDADGYYKDNVARLVADKNGHVTVLELEGDFVFDRSSTETVIIQDVCLYVAAGTNQPELIRVEEGEQFSTYIVFQYHLEGPQFANAASPLMKGMPIARIAAQAMNRVMEAAQLKNQPPVRYSPDDPHLAAEGGPNLYPSASFKSVEGVDVLSDVGGEPQELFNVFAALVAMYEGVTGVTPARQGAETKSHTTAFAKDIEVSRGQTRTVDYVNATMNGQMTRLLEIEYRMGLDMMHGNSKEIVFLQDWQEFVQLQKGHLPDIVKFMAVGSDAPAEEQQAIIQKVQAVQGALQIDATAVQLGQKPTIKNVKPMIEELLRDGGWDSLEAFFVDAAAAVPSLPQSPGILTGPPSLAIAR
jgi:hypothetical protein